ncbi:uncharacterized protein TNCV_2476381 [Trichonephila clavipes]|nr:uncharacterized protein TNCV_2476381 [Trichonephila clavipes]
MTSHSSNSNDVEIDVPVNGDVSIDPPTKSDTSEYKCRIVSYLLTYFTESNSPKGFRAASDPPRGSHVTLLRGKDHRIRCIAVVRHTASAAEFRAAVGTTVTQRTIRNRLLHGQNRAWNPVACIPLIPSHYHLRRLWCHARTHFRIERRSVMFSDESRFCLDASDD